MCGIVGFVNYKQDVSRFRNILINMNNTLVRRGPDEDGYYIRKHIALAHKRLIVIDPEGGKQPMVTTYDENEYSIVYNGQIYNTSELRNVLIENGFIFNTTSDTEVLLKAFIFYGYNVVKHLNGIFAFAIWNKNKEELFLARDHFGIKPLFYTTTNDNLIFASEIKALFEFPGVEKVIDQNGVCELFGVGPAHTAGTTVFKDIYELKPAHFAIFNKYGLFVHRYWKFISKPHVDSFEETCMKVKYLLEDSIKRQLVADVPLCVFLSGGLDSSIITAYASDYCRRNNLPPLNTFSVDYVDNDKNFVKSDFQPNSDNYYINLMVEKYKTNHTNIVLDTPDLAKYLEDAMIARDVPGMADVDSSMLLLCKNVKQYATVSLSGECADEIFGGYPWFYREDLLASDTFPWMIDLTPRKQLLDPEFADALQMDDYVKNLYHQIISEIPVLPEESDIEKSRRRIGYMNIRMFMQTLLDRMDRTSMYNGLEARVPFADIHLLQYVFNVPWKYKYRNQTEKSLLRHAAVNLVPNEILFRKKSPYPKTYNPLYETILADRLREVIDDPTSPVNRFLEKKAVLQFLESPKDYGKPWYGQLMAGPQMMAYLLQINYWLKEYQISIEL